MFYPFINAFTAPIQYKRVLIGILWFVFKIGNFGSSFIGYVRCTHNFSLKSGIDRY